MIKQYTIEPAYSHNSKFTTYENGKCIKQFIISDYEIPGYQRWAEGYGYELAFDEDYYLQKYREAEEAYQQAIADLDMARSHMLIKMAMN